MGRKGRNRSLTLLAACAIGSATAGSVAATATATPASALVPVVSVVPAALSAALPATASATDARMARALTARATTAVFGTRFSGQVVDVGSRAVVWGSRASTGLMPASTTKLVTASNALSVFGPTHRFTTTVHKGSTWDSVVLVGAGDPSLSSADLSVLVGQTVTQLRAHAVRRAKVWYDDYLFAPPTLATGWKASYVPEDVRAVRSLVVDERHGANTSLDAAQIFASKLTAAGIGVVSLGRAQAPAGSPVTASVQGDPLDAIVTRMMLRSDNDHAEALHRLVALAKGQRATWAGAATAQQAVLAKHGVLLAPTQLYDGSGLSRSDRLSAAQLVRIVRRILNPAYASQRPLATTALPVSGRTGTLSASLGRYTEPPSSCAAGLVHAKTGTLGDAVALSGWTKGADGRVKAFGFVVNSMGDSLAMKRQVDTLAATVTGCY